MSSEVPSASSVPATAAFAEIDALADRAWTLRLSDPRAGVAAAEEARAAAEAAGYRRGVASALKASGACRCLLLDHDAALADLAVAGEIFDELGDGAGKAKTVDWTGRVHWRRSEYPEAQRAHTAALRLYRETGDRPGEADSLIALGNVHYNAGDLPGALEMYHAALPMGEALRDPLVVSHCLNNIGNIHGRLEQYDRALEYHERALVLKREVGDTTGEGIALVNLGSSYEALEDYPRALAFFTAAWEHCRLHGDRLTESGALCDLGHVHRKTGAFDHALAYYREAAEAARSVESAYVEADARMGLGQALLVLGDVSGAVEEISGALALAERVGSRHLVYEAHLALAEAYEAAGDAAKALEHFRAYHRVEDEVFSAEAERRIQTVLVKAEVEASQREAELLRAKNDELSTANDEKARLLEVLRRQAEELERLSRQDALTGLFNRRHVDAALALEWERASRFGRDLTVAMADIDRFKAVNDRFSHAVGDEVLRRVGEILRGGTRAVDVVGRWGGEEFVLLLVETPPERAAGLCEKLRAAVEAHDWSAVAPGLAVTLSLGVAGNGEAAGPAALLAAADARLYQAKRAGRNRVVAPE